MARVEDFERIATQTVTGLLTKVTEMTGHAPTANVALEYLGQYTQRTRAITQSANRIVPQRSTIIFMLQADASGTTTCHVVTARCDNVIQGASVPVPQEWRARSATTALPHKAAATAEGTAQPLGGVRCTILGVPKAVEIPVQAGKLLPGAALVVATHFERELPILHCAPLSGNLWYAHRRCLHGQFLDAAARSNSAISSRSTSTFKSRLPAQTVSVHSSRPRKSTQLHLRRSSPMLGGLRRKIAHVCASAPWIQRPWRNSMKITPSNGMRHRGG